MQIVTACVQDVVGMRSKIEELIDALKLSENKSKSMNNNLVVLFNQLNIFSIVNNKTCRQNYSYPM
jgi:hypothetical protein